jgi:hypothetical protein
MPHHTYASPRKGFIAVLSLDRISKQAQSRRPLFLSSALSSPYQDIGLFTIDARYATMDCFFLCYVCLTISPHNLHISILGVDYAL